jgi:hypothetical protein
MALLRLPFKPGVDKQNTEYGAEGGWVDSDYVRFRYGLPEKLGGWTDFDETAVNFVGAVSEIFTWNGLGGEPYAAIGTNRKVYAFYGGTWADITPIRDTNSVTFTTVSGSTTVTVNDTAHGAIAGDFVTISATTGNPGGIPNASLNNEFEIQFVPNANTYTVISPAAATSTASTVGTATAAYQLNTGSDISFVDFGWGTGTWGFSTWGTPRPPSAALSLFARVWQFDSYGENLILQLVDGGIYEWLPSTGLATRATAIAGAPTKSKYALISTPDRHLVCFGTETTLGSPTTQDPMFVRFSDQENIGDFVATATNTAGGQRLADGNEIRTALRSRGQILIWTDTSLHGQQYLGPPYTFGFQQLGANCGVIGPHAAVDVNGVAYWMGSDAIYMFDGTVKKLACTVQDYVFGDINLIQSTSVSAGINSQFNEVSWFYATSDSNYVNRFVTYNYLENVWSIGTMARTAWTDASTFEKPTASEYSPTDTASTISTIYGLTAGRSQLYSQETGVDANGSAIDAFVYSGYFDIGDGDQMLLMQKFIPDFKRQVGNISVQLRLRAYPQATAVPSSLDPYVIAPGTEFVSTRARGRQVQLRIESDEISSFWRFGTMRVDLQPDGNR